MLNEKTKRSFLQETIDLFIQEIQKDDVQKRLKTYIIEPSFSFMFDRLYPYIILTMVIFVLLLLLTILILVFLLRGHASAPS
jgi:hypothetical protein